MKQKITNNFGRYILFILLMFGLPGVGVFAQDQYTKEKLNRIIPVSPNAASLGIFGQIPVGHHTGVPQISVPVHEIDFHGLKIPIELDYHASGIKVAQEASSVGLGWALNAGGCITRNILHLDDFQMYNGYYKSTKARPANASPLDSRDYLPFMGFNGTCDSQPDFFSYSFSTHSGTFFLKPRGESNGIASLMGKENDVRIQYIEGENKWEVIDALGFKYIFGTSANTRETTRAYSMPGGYPSDISSISRARFTSRDLAPLVTAWYLESIVSPLNDTVTFTYRKERLLSPYRFSEEKYYQLDFSYPVIENLNASYDYSFISYSENEQLLLSAIEYEGGSVEFGYEVRTDLQLSNVTNIAKKLTSVSVYEHLTGSGPGNGKKRVKHCTLSHSYMGWNPANSEISRLTLDEVCFMSVDPSSTDVKKYQFTYNPGVLPSKYSQAVDYWGYYNSGSSCLGTRGQTNISPFIHLGGSWSWQTTSFGGWDRTPNEDYVKYGLLRSMKYPTGGKTVFEFELHDFTDKIEVGTPSGNIDLSRGGGVRIKRIIDYLNDTDISSIRRFVYQKDGCSSGRLRIIPKHYRYVYVGDWRTSVTLPYFAVHIPYINIHSEGFSSSILNAGNVGYSYVEEHNVTDGENNGYTAYHFANHTGSVDTRVFDVPVFISSLNGKPQQTIHYNSDGIPVKKRTFNYSTFSRGSVIGFKCYAPPMYDSYFILNNRIESDFHVAYYPMVSDCVLESTVTEEEYFPNGTLTKTITYGYDGTFNLKNYQKTTVSGNVYETYIKYPQAFTDSISVAMKNRHIIGVPVETVNTLNGSVIDAQKTVFSTFYTHNSPCYLPASIYGLRKTQPLSLSAYQNHYDKEVRIDAYDSSGNVSQYTDRDNLKVVYLWSGDIYPVAVIRNATVEAVDHALISLNIDMEELAGRRPDVNFLSGLQEQLPEAQVTLFTHKPQMGVTSISAPSGKAVYYDYDGLGRLIQVKNGENHKIENYHYNYSNH